MVAHSPSSKSSKLPSSSEEGDEHHFDPRKTLFFPVPIYMGSPIQS